MIKKVFDKHTMKCINCNEDMIVDDVDYNFKGNYDIYWLCPKCDSGAVEEVRFGSTKVVTYLDCEVTEIKKINYFRRTKC